MVLAVRGGAGAVLVVEDEPLIRLSAVDLLEDEGFEVIEAGSGDEGLVLLKARPDIRVLFTDVHVPGSLDGLALARIAAAEHRHVHLLIVSGRGVPEPDALPEGASFLVKPYRVASMIAHVHAGMRA